MLVTKAFFASGVCFLSDPQLVEMITRKTAMSQPYTIFADFEALGENVVQAETITETKKISKHVPYSAYYCVVSTERSVLEAGYLSFSLLSVMV